MLDGTSVALGIEIHGLTAVGRTTVIVLGMNAGFRRMMRYRVSQESARR